MLHHASSTSLIDRRGACIAGRSWHPRGRGVGMGITPAVPRLWIAVDHVTSGNGWRPRGRRGQGHHANGTSLIDRPGPCDRQQKLAPTWARRGHGHGHHANSTSLIDRSGLCDRRQKLAPTRAGRGHGHHASGESLVDRRGPCDGRSWHPRGHGVGVGITPAMRRWSITAICVIAGRSWHPRGRDVGVGITLAVRCWPIVAVCVLIRPRLPPTWAREPCQRCAVRSAHGC